jgi:hypothetical protein
MRTVATPRGGVRFQAAGVVALVLSLVAGASADPPARPWTAGNGITGGEASQPTSPGGGLEPTGASGGYRQRNYH